MSGAPALSLHICNARGDLTGCSGWLSEAIRATHARAAGYLPLGPLDVILRAGRQVVPEKGHVGLAPGPGIVILTVDPEKKRIGVALVPEGSTRAAAMEEAESVSGATQEAADVREYTERAESETPERFGSLADKLRGALKPREK